MKVKLNQKLQNVEGKDIVEGNNPALTLKDVIYNSILTPIKDENEKSKLEKWEIFKKVKDQKVEVELTVEQVSLIKKSIGVFQPVLIMGQCFEMLENPKKT